MKNLIFTFAGNLYHRPIVVAFNNLERPLLSGLYNFGVVKCSTNQSLGIKDSVCQLTSCLLDSRPSYERVTFSGEANNRRGCRLAILDIWQLHDLAILEYARCSECRAKINANVRFGFNDLLNHLNLIILIIIMN